MPDLKMAVPAPYASLLFAGRFYRQRQGKVRHAREQYPEWNRANWISVANSPPEARSVEFPLRRIARKSGPVLPSSIANRLLHSGRPPEGWPRSRSALRRLDIQYVH